MFKRFAAVAGVGVAAAPWLPRAARITAPPRRAVRRSGSTGTPRASRARPGTLTLAGSSAQANAISQWTKDYQTACPDATINYNPSGSGCGRDRLRAEAGRTSPVPTSRCPPPTSPRPTRAAAPGNKAINIPLVPGAIAVMYNLSGVTAQLNLSAQTLAKIFNGKITTWNDAAIGKDNPGVNAAGDEDHHVPPGRQVRHLVQLLQLPQPDRPGRLPGRGEQAVARHRRAGRERQLRAWRRRSRPPPAASATRRSPSPSPTACRRRRSATPRASSSTRPRQNASAFIAKAKVTAERLGPAAGLRLQLRRPGAYPAVLVTYEIACATGNDSGAAPPDQGLPHLRGRSTTAQGELPAAGYVQLPANIQTLVQASINSPEADRTTAGCRRAPARGGSHPSAMPCPHRLETP